MKLHHLVIQAIKFCGFLCAVYTNTASAVMNTPSNWSVSPSGAFTYEIPFRLPPGIAGVQPKLSLQYSSQAGNGLAGMGWNLSGLSAITRCPRIMAVDGVRGGVNMDANDRLCLDGQRLMLQSGTYGAEGATYATEIYNGSRIVGTTLTGTGNTRTFKVYTKAGELMEYTPFNTPTNDAALMFMLSRVTDAKGNYWQVHYQADIAQGEIYPKAICYTGNSRLSQAPKNCVEFGYGADTSRYSTPVQRTDKSLAYMAGFAMSNNQRLSGIRTLINATATASGNTWIVSGTQVNEYRLNYDATYSPVNKSLLKTVQECATSTMCLPIRLLAYNELSTISPVVQVKSYDPLFGTAFPAASEIKTGDFNADGKADFIRLLNASTGYPKTYDGVLNSNASLHHSSVSNSFLNLPLNAAGISPSSLVWYGYTSNAGDYDGDGLSDLFVFVDAGAYETGGGQGLFDFNIYFNIWYGERSGGFSVRNYHVRFVAPDYYVDTFSPHPIRFGDFNGDGLQDVKVDVKISSFKERILGEIGEFAPQATHLITYSDFTGDGKSDGLRFSSDTQIVISRSNGDGTFTDLPGFSTSVHGASSSNQRFVYGDFNADGKSDLVHLGSATAVRTWLSKGDGSFDVKDAAPGQTFDAAANEYRFHVGDFNGDGLTDMVQIISATQVRYWMARGDGTFSITAATTVKEHNSTADYNFSLNNYNIQVVDFNGDGKSDLMHAAEPPYFRALITAPTDKASLKLSDVTVGPNITTVDYGYLSSTPNYQVSGTPAAGQRVVRGALPVVTQIKSSNGLPASQNTQTFKYGNALSEPATGRGFLGFGWMESQMQGSDGVFGPVSRSVYSQQWPCIGMPVQSQIKLPTGSLKSQSDSVIRVRTPANATLQACGTAALNGQVVIPFASESTARQWEMTPASQQGAELPRSRTTTTVDAHGNPVQIQEQTLNADGSASGYSRTTNNTYDSNAERARQGRLIKSTVTHVKP